MSKWMIRLALGILAFLTLPILCAAQSTIKADRTPLTFHESGLYTNHTFVHGRDPAEDGVTNLLPVSRAVADGTPWDFYIMQFGTNNPNESAVKMLRTMARNGKRIILRLGIGRAHVNPDPEKMEKWIGTLFEHVDPDWLYAVTLDEEQVYWYGWAKALSDLYYRVKRRWPQLPVYQWWTPMVAPDVNARHGWVALPADGWIMDLYGLHAPEFEQKVRMFLATGKPVVHIAWASPKWMFYDKKGYAPDTWWRGIGIRVLKEQLRICRKYDVPVAFFVAQNQVARGGKIVEPIRWGWHAVDPDVRMWYLELEQLVEGDRLLSFLE